VAATGLPEVKPWVLWPAMAVSVVAAGDYVGVFVRWLRGSGDTITTDEDAHNSDRHA
jgi:hypothetical protein